MSSDYVLLDSGNLKKLEQVGPYRLIRPALNAFWRPSLPETEWRAADAEFVRDSSGHGKWRNRERIPDVWQAHWGGVNMQIKPTNFGHLGFFAEQFRNWQFFRENCRNMDTLNLFAYSGLGSISMAAGGARVCHLDAAKGMIEWGRENLTLNPEVPSTVRWIADDVNKFVNRELRRGNRYDLVALDPPTFGRGTSGQLWKIESDLPQLLRNCLALRKDDREFRIVLSCHSPGFSLLVLERMVREVAGRSAEVIADEMFIPESTGKKLPSGIGLHCVVR
ncbi:MAG: SAM-dependent methyltransferase [Lentisphaerae bacterium]|nr:SAM-dependent methyltransferase [Lentisphaerota bacterium]